MFYSFDLSEFPIIENLYTVIRNTVWQIADKTNILVFIMDGSCEFLFNNECFILEKGDIFYIPAGYSYTRKPIDNKMCTMTYIHFSVSSDIEQNDMEELRESITKKRNILNNELLSSETNMSYLNTVYLQNKNTLREYKRIVALISEINLYSTNRTLMCNLQSAISLCEILIYLSQSTLDKISADDTIRDAYTVPVNLKKAIGYIARNYSEQITLADLSEYCFVSKQQIIRYFKASLNTTPIRYIMEYKVSRSKDLLFNYPQLTIKEISAELGFDNQHYFTRVFTKVTGETPSHYRHRVLNYDNGTNT